MRGAKRKVKRIFAIFSWAKRFAEIDPNPIRMTASTRPMPNIYDVAKRARVSVATVSAVINDSAFVSADLDKASESNERNSLLITSDGRRVGVVQIAGLVARRIVCFVREGSTVAAGERIGMIRFGSRVDIYLPAGARPLVAEGQTAIAGETVIADLAGGAAQRSFRVD